MLKSRFSRSAIAHERLLYYRKERVFLDRLEEKFNRAGLNSPNRGRNVAMTCNEDNGWTMTFADLLLHRKAVDIW
ncbi:hypothetical protein GRAN_2305 [Granulicella sibirica]|uniref:Uncharacterized protein n=1 Tax=Granulicella sibirica TaxID=2479048 RepID=A0A4Q0T0H3_9BACT|nr:hypothetical protein GRAN_2305 [Granulicella sibirica]